MTAAYNVPGTIGHPFDRTIDQNIAIRRIVGPAPRLKYLYHTHDIAHHADRRRAFRRFDHHRDVLPFFPEWRDSFAITEKFIVLAVDIFHIPAPAFERGVFHRAGDREGLAQRRPEEKQ